MFSFAGKMSPFVPLTLDNPQHNQTHTHEQLRPGLTVAVVGVGLDCCSCYHSKEGSKEKEGVRKKLWMRRNACRVLYICFETIDHHC